jgi:hypothetical protein
MRRISRTLIGLVMVTLSAVPNSCGQNSPELPWRRFRWVTADCGGTRLERAALTVPVTLAGSSREHYFQLDLGATQSSLHGGTIRDTVPTLPLSGGAARISGSIAGVTVVNEPIAVLPDFRATLCGAAPLAVIGTLGLDFFEHRILVLDYPARRLLVLQEGERGSTAVPTNVVFFDVEHRDGKLYIPVEFDGARQSGFFFDTGASALAMVTSESEWTHLTGRRRSDPANVQMTVSSWETEVTLVGGPMAGVLSLGPVSLSKPTIWFCNDERLTFANWPSTRGLIGNMLFAGHSVVVLDLPRHRLGVAVKR